MKTVVISLGGSVIVPDKVDYKYLEKFRKVILRFSRRNKVVIVTGGGKTARRYLKPLQKAGASTKVASLVGIASTRLNARLVEGVFGLSEDIPESLSSVKRLLKKQNLVICGALGEKENMTSDGNAAEVAGSIKADYFYAINFVHFFIHFKLLSILLFSIK